MLSRRIFLRAAALFQVVAGLFAAPTFAEASSLNRRQVLRTFNIPTSVIGTTAADLPCAQCVAAEPLSAIQVSKILNVLGDEMYSCPGERWMEDAGHEDWDTRQPTDYLGSYDQSGRCTNMVQMWYDRWPGEFGGLGSGELRVEAPCADIHGLNDQTGAYAELETRYSERRQLLKKVKAILA